LLGLPAFYNLPMFNFWKLALPLDLACTPGFFSIVLYAKIDRFSGLLVLAL
jgi:hypothetical protein